ncbi:MAG: hypothetical protein GXY25_22355 [Pirellulaceae bacterium]|nr:hypothetical protein [Planctomycetota bacterium]NLZ03267.1 hypothetical protein [Pirellulaceae bacterium]
MANPADRLPLRQEDGVLEITVPESPLDPVNTVVAAMEGALRVEPRIAPPGQVRERGAP